MKMILLALTLVTVSAQAAPKACDDFMVCGTYEGTGASYDDKNQKRDESDFVESWSLTAVDDLTIRFEQSMYPEGKPEEVFYRLDLDIVFQADGTYKAIRRGTNRLYAAGICQTGRVCTLSMIPFDWKNPETGETGVTGNVNILRFENNKLSREMMASVFEGKLSFQRASLTKK